MALFVGTDIGGTFTDIVGFDAERQTLSFGKKLTNRGDLVEGVVSCLHDVGLAPRSVDVLKHGTTQVINTLLERKGARTALVTTAGFKDILEIGRAGRPVAFDLHYKREAPLVERSMCFEVDERIDARGAVVRPLTPAALASLKNALEAARVEAVAISFLNAYANPDHERQVAKYLRESLPGVYVAAGSELSREWYEYERTSTAAANAYIGPRAAGYVDRFDRRLAEERFGGVFYMMGSNGGVLPVARAREQPIALIESGPIGGCVGASVYAKQLGIRGLVAFDMGGTTAKCALVEDGFFEIQGSYYVGGYDRGLPLRTPVLDIVEVGTGGGSIAYLDGRRLRVGPRSAGSEPGPVCFGKGGRDPTVTDANLVLGRISGSRFLNGALPLDAAAAREAMAEKIGSGLGYQGTAAWEDVAAGILTLANAQMATAIKEITIERGKDVRDFVLFAFGGGGPMHGIDLARELRIPRVIVPPEPGNFSALGMLFADARVDDMQSFRLSMAELGAGTLGERTEEMRERVRRTLSKDFGAETAVYEYQAEMRFKGQKHSLRVPFSPMDDGKALAGRLFASYLRKYGHVDEQSPVEVIGVRVAGFASTGTPDVRLIHKFPPAGRPTPREHREVRFSSSPARVRTSVYARESLPRDFEIVGPVIVEEFGATTVVGPDERLRVGTFGEMAVELAI